MKDLQSYKREFNKLHTNKPHKYKPLPKQLNYDISQYLPKKNYLHYPQTPQNQIHSSYQQNNINTANTHNREVGTSTEMGIIKKRDNKIKNQSMQTEKHLQIEAPVCIQICPPIIQKNISIQTQMTNQTQHLFTEQVQQKSMLKYQFHPKQQSRQQLRPVRYKVKKQLIARPHKTYESSYCLQNQLKVIARQLLNIR